MRYWFSAWVLLKYQEMKNKVQILSNVSMIQINFDGINADVYLKENTMYRNKVITDIRAFVAPSGSTIYSPFDGKQLLDASYLDRLYIDLVRDDKTIVAEGLNLKQLDIMANAITSINEVLNFSMSKVSYMDDATLSQTAGKCVLLYVYYDTITTSESSDMIYSVSIPIARTDAVVCLQDYISDYIGQQNQRVVGIESKTLAGNWFLSLRDKSGKTFEYYPSDRLEMNDKYNTHLIHPTLLDCFDVDFRNSYIYNATTGLYQTNITFFYR